MRKCNLVCNVNMVHNVHNLPKFECYVCHRLPCARIFFLFVISVRRYSGPYCGPIIAPPPSPPAPPRPRSRRRPSLLLLFLRMCLYPALTSNCAHRALSLSRARSRSLQPRVNKTSSSSSSSSSSAPLQETCTSDLPKVESHSSATELAVLCSVYNDYIPHQQPC